jgi:hypothetical protein
MRGLTTWALAIALGLGFVASAAADENSDSSNPRPERNPLGFHWSPMFAHAAGWDQEPDAPKKPAPKPKKTPAKKEAVAPKPAPAVDQGAAQRAREEAALLRRLAVCDKLKEIAIRTNDSDLLARVEALDERARAAYTQHTASMKAGSSGVDLDEQILDQHLGVPTASRQSQEQGLTVTSNSEDRGRRAATGGGK